MENTETVNQKRKNVPFPAETIARVNKIAKENGLKQYQFCNAAMLYVLDNDDAINEVIKRAKEIKMSSPSYLSQKIKNLTRDQQQRIIEMIEKGNI